MTGRKTYRTVLRGLWLLALCGLLQHPGAADSAVREPTLIALENSRSGTPDWLLHNPATRGEIQGYASSSSLTAGDNLLLFVDTLAKTYRVEIFRVGWYGGEGARRIAKFEHLPGLVQRKPCENAGHIIDCAWAPSLVLTPPVAADARWISGVYLARLTNEDEAAKDSYILFVVRDDEKQPRFLVQVPITTYEAYNRWGGQSLYVGCAQDDPTDCSPKDKAGAVSFNRPFGPSPNARAAFGTGAGEFLTNLQPGDEDYDISSAGFDINMVRWIERQGLDVGYMTSLDLHQRPRLLERARAFVSMGHDEYYSSAMRQNLVDRLSTGLNVGFFSSNEMYWRIRFEPSPTDPGTPDRIIVCYKNGDDPVHDESLTTGRFRQLGQPEAAIIGSQYVFDPVESYIQIAAPRHWLLAGASAHLGQRLDGLLGYEVNAVDGRSSPSNVQVIARTDNGNWSSDMTYYVGQSGAQVFSTGTMQWSWGLDDFVSNKLRRNFRNRVAEVITSNVFTALADDDLVRLVNVENGRILGVSSNETSARLVDAADASGPRWAWRLVPLDRTNHFQLVSRGNGLCLTRDAGGDVHFKICDGQDGQDWLVTCGRNGRVAASSSRAGMQASWKIIPQG
jgi:hypothetical protein